MEHEDLWNDIKKYLTLKTDYLKLSAIEKLIILLSMIALSAVLAMLLICALFYFSFALVYVLSDVVGPLWLAYLIVGGVFVILMAVVFVLRKSLIFDPISRFLTKLFLDKQNEK